jgi:4-amino-4-deoxy-L-arabinose transferase-like glycosyltransferase
LTTQGKSAGQARWDLGAAALVVGLVLGALTRFWHLDAASLFTDEAYTFAIASLPVPALLETLARSDYHPPLFYLRTHALLHVVHLPLWDYRYFCAPFGLLTILATWGAARRMFGPVAAAVAAIVVALSPALIVYDRIYRMYAPFVALATVSWWLLVSAQPAQGRRRTALWAFYALTAVLLVYTHYLGILVLACQALYALANWSRARAAFIAYALVLAAYVPWLPQMRRQLALGGLAVGRPGLDAGLAHSVSGAFAMGIPGSMLAWAGGDWLALGIVLVLAVAGAWLGRRTALPFWLGTLAVAVVLSVAASRNLAYFSRYLLVDIPPVAIAFGVIIQTLAASRARLAAAAVATACVALLGIGATNVLVDPYYQFPDWYAVNAAMLAAEKPDDAIVLDAGYEYLVVHDYSGFRGRLILSFMNPGDFAPILHWIADHPRARVWYVQSQSEYWDPKGRIAAALRPRPVVIERRFPRQAPENAVTLILFDAMPKSRT